MTPGPRQTIDRAHVHELGEGRLVYHNGPCVFLPDEGEPLPLQRMSVSGAGWHDAITASGDRVRFDTRGRQGGERHHRRWSPLFGAGWLVDEAWPVWRAGMSAADEARYKAARGWCRFEPDDGSEPIRWQWHQMRVGRLTGREPRHPKDGKKPSPARVEWDMWSVIEGYEFRREPPPDAAQGQVALPT